MISIKALVLILVWLVGANDLAPSVFAQPARSERRQELFRTKHETLRATLVRQTLETADLCESLGYLDEAQALRLRAAQVTTDVDWNELPEKVIPSLSLSLPEPELRWRSKLRKAEQDFANDLYRLARESLSRGHASLAFQLVREVAYYHPDHEPARKMLGYQRDGTNWTTPYEKRMKARGFIDHQDFGWMPARNVARYEAGERFHNGTWISKEREAAICSDFRTPWEIQTEHFTILTNHSQEKGVEIARELEEFYSFFLRNFTSFFNTPQQMQRLFSHGQTEINRQFTVHYYSSQEDFISALKSLQPNVEMINGLYIPQKRIAYFYNDPENPSLETIFHEVTHQILGESTMKVIDVGEAANFWVIEGIACYMESFRPDHPTMKLGNPNHIRVYWARRKALEDSFYVPMRTFTAMGKNDFQYPPDTSYLHPYYSQAAGMVHFFLHYGDGEYRDAFIKYLSDIYSPVVRIRQNVKSLEVLTGVPFETLDRQYLEYLESLPATLPHS